MNAISYRNYSILINEVVRIKLLIWFTNFVFIKLNLIKKQCFR